MKMIFVRMGKGEKMRLIDADNLKIPSDAPYKASVKRVVAQQPTVEAVPVVHGEWIHVQSSDMATARAYECSNCKKMRYGSFLPPFCQMCGADMKKKERK